MVESVEEVTKSVQTDALKGTIATLMSLFEDLSIYASEHESNGLPGE
jgi:hypothetical protein